MMKTKNISIIALHLFFFSNQLSAQQFEIEINQTNLAGMKIKNTSTSSASASTIDLLNANDKLFQLGIVGDNNRFFGADPAAYLFTSLGQNLPIAFATEGKERMRIDSEGRIGIGQDNSLNALLTLRNKEKRETLFVSQDSARAAVSIYHQGDNFAAIQITAQNHAGGIFINADSSTALNIVTANSSSSTFHLLQKGTGAGGDYIIDNPNSNSSSLLLRHNGNGHGLSIAHTGSGTGANIVNNSAASAIDVRNNGSGHALFVRGTAMRQDADPNWDTTSDRRLKKDIRRFKDGLEVIAKINPVFFHYNGLCGISPEKENVGIIAQEIEQIAPYMVTKKDMLKYPEDNENQEVMKDVLTYNPTALPYILVNAVKTLNNKIEAQNKFIDSQNKAIKNLTKRLNQLEQLQSQVLSN